MEKTKEKLLILKIPNFSISMVLSKKTFGKDLMKSINRAVVIVILKLFEWVFHSNPTIAANLIL